MTPNPTEAFATRLPRTEADRLHAAMDETGWTKARLVRRAVLYYIEKNPDEILVLYPEGSTERFFAEMME